MPLADLSPLNDREYRKLLLTLTLNSQELDLLIAITDDRNLQDQLITAYEAELKAQSIAPLRVRLDPKRPSLRATLEDLAAQTPALQAGEPAVVTVLNAGELLGVRLNDEKSEQEKFFFSLQWTREALREFACPIVLWLPDAVATRLAQQAPDFWSWRGGVFEFVAEARVPGRGGVVPMPSREMGMEEKGSPVALEDLQQQIAQLEQTAPESPLLITLYNNLGEQYVGQYDYQKALELYAKSLTLAASKSDHAGQARSLFNIGVALALCGRSHQALDYYQQALDKYRKLDINGELATLNQIGISYHALGQYSKAVEYYQKSLGIAQKIGDQFGEAAALSNLGLTCYAMGQYPQAIENHQQSLIIERAIGNRWGELGSLGNLGLAYSALGSYAQSIDYYKKSLTIARQIGDLRSIANSLGNLGISHKNLKRYSQAIHCYQQQLVIVREIGDRHGEANALGGLGVTYSSLGQYPQAIEYYQQQLAIAREIGDRFGEATSLFNSGVALTNLDQIQEARSTYQAACALFEAMEQQHYVEKCDAALRELEMLIASPDASQKPP